MRKNMDVHEFAKDENGLMILPSGYCLCGCGERTKKGSYFLVGHDKKALCKLAEGYGGVVSMLVALKYPGTEELRRVK